MRRKGLICSLLATFGGPLTQRALLALFVAVTWVLSALLLGLIHETEHLGKRWVVRGLFFAVFSVSMTALFQLFELH